MYRGSSTIPKLRIHADFIEDFVAAFRGAEGDAKCLKAKTRVHGVLDEVCVSGRGALAVQRSRTVRSGGAQSRENAGISSEKTGENPVRRKPKVS